MRLSAVQSRNVQPTTVQPTNVQPTNVQPTAVLRSTSLPLATLTVDHGAIARNTGRILERSGVAVMAVVKADAFGHGAVEVARTVLDAGATWLGVATVEEGLELRAADIHAPVFAWLVDPWTDLESAIFARITLSCANVETLRAIENAALALGITADVHLELDTGMARGGSTAELWPALCEAAADVERSGGVRVTGIWSHLALAGVPTPESVAPSLDAIFAAQRVAARAGLRPQLVHLANSAAVFAHPTTALSMVRVGAALYGIDTVRGVASGCEPAMRLTSRVTQLRLVEAGVGVGYLHSYRTTAPTRLALVPLGYGDGIPRSLSLGGSVSIGGKRYPIRGSISMDQLVVEIDESVALGDEVVLLGDADRGEPTAAEWAALVGTVPHEILTGFGRRITRVSRQKASL